MRLQGKVVLVTGAASGIGHAVTELFAREGATVVASDVKSPDQPYAAGVESLTLDVTSEANWAEAVEAIVRKHGRLDLEAWHRMIAVDQTGVFLGMREAVRAMRGRNPGSIVNISSIWGSAAVAGAHSYHAAKGAVRNMSKNAAMTYVADGIRVNSVHPGFIHTPLTDAQAPDLNGAVIGATPMKRGGTPMEIAYGVLYLASDESSYVTGTELVIDGGYLAQ
jgi:3alpha(or 20beta)-hydroxysteroid dehydrogenase